MSAGFSRNRISDEKKSVELLRRIHPRRRTDAKIGGIPPLVYPLPAAASGGCSVLPNSHWWGFSGSFLLAALPNYHHCIPIPSPPTPSNSCVEQMAPDVRLLGQAQYGRPLETFRVLLAMGQQARSPPVKSLPMPLSGGQSFANSPKETMDNAGKPLSMQPSFPGSKDESFSQIFQILGENSFGGPPSAISHADSRAAPPVFFTGFLNRAPSLPSGRLPPLFTINIAAAPPLLAGPSPVVVSPGNPQNRDEAHKLGCDPFDD